MYLNNWRKSIGAGIILLIVCIQILTCQQYWPPSHVVVARNVSSANNTLRSNYLYFQPNSLATSVSYSHRQEIDIDCALRNFSPLPLPITALASFPGSGNTWSRQIIELISGIYTGAIYNDGSLSKIFKGEGKRDWSVVAVKTHSYDTNVSAGYCKPLLDSRDCELKRAIIVIRHPADAALAEFKRHRAHSHTKDAKAPIKDLRDDLTTATANLAYFLGIEMDDTRIKCLLDYNQGYFHREGKTVNITRVKENNNTTASSIEKVRKLFESCVTDKKCATSGSLWNL